MAARAKEEMSLAASGAVADDDLLRAADWRAALDHAARAHHGQVLINEDERPLRAAAKVISQSRDTHFTAAILYRMAADLVARSHPMVIIDLLAGPPRARARSTRRRRRGHRRVAGGRA